MPPMSLKSLPALGYLEQVSTMWRKEICANVDWEREELLQALDQAKAGKGDKPRPPRSRRPRRGMSEGQK